MSERSHANMDTISTPRKIGRRDQELRTPMDLSALNIKEHTENENVFASAVSTARNTSLKAESSVGSVMSDNDLDPKLIHFVAERLVGRGAFGSVYLAKEVSTNTRVAIKKVLQDRKHINRELSIMRQVSRYPHPFVIQLRKYFVTKGAGTKDVFLNLVLDYIPDTLSTVSRRLQKEYGCIPISFLTLTIYQLARALAHIHGLGITHRDLKPQNILVDERNYVTKLCDFGSAKQLVPGEPNVAYICSRHYRAPELIFGSSEYSSSIDIWSLGCVMAEMMIGSPIFPGCSAVDQIIEVIKVLGAPTQVQLVAMNPTFTSLRLPQLIAKPLRERFGHATPPEALDVLVDLLHYVPAARPPAIEICARPFCDSLRAPGARLLDGSAMPLANFHFTPQELSFNPGIVSKLVLPHIQERLGGSEKQRKAGRVRDVQQNTPHSQSYSPRANNNAHHSVTNLTRPGGPITDPASPRPP